MRSSSSYRLCALTFKLISFSVVRTAKITQVQEAYDVSYGRGRVEIVGINDLANGDFGPLLKGKFTS